VLAFSEKSEEGCVEDLKPICSSMCWTRRLREGNVLQERLTSMVPALPSVVLDKAGTANASMRPIAQPRFGNCRSVEQGIAITQCEQWASWKIISRGRVLLQ
jgi:hypothetical protein